jgi:ribonuclease P protein component
MVYLAEVPEGAPRTRLAFAVTRRVGSAVVRNRLRRRLRAILTGLGPRLPAGAVLVSAGPGAVARDPDELRHDVVSLLDALDHRLLGERR